MNQTITLTPEQQEAFNAGKPVTITLQKPVEQWEPRGGDFYIDGGGAVHDGIAGFTGYQNFGTEYPTKELAEKARDAMRVHNRLLAYVMEHAPDWDNGEFDKRYVYFDHLQNRFMHTVSSSADSIGTVYMPEQVAKDLCEKLNNGIVNL